METNIVKVIESVENFLAKFVDDNITKSLSGGLQTYILPKMDKENTEFVAILLTTVPSDILDSAELQYRVITRLARIRETLFEDRNTIIGIFQTLQTDLEDKARAEKLNAFRYTLGEMEFQLDDDFYDIVFPVDILI